jgi:hypothetical protein
MKTSLLTLLFMMLMAQFASAQPEKKLNPNMLEEVKRAIRKIPKNRILKKAAEVQTNTDSKIELNE